MDLNLGALKRYASAAGMGLMKEMAPRIAGGFINELFHQWHVDVARITKDVQDNRSLWGEMESDQRRQIGGLAKRVGNLDFITSEFLIDSIKKDFPGVASLFLNWPEAAEWLAKQIDDLKAGVNGVELQSH